MPCTLQTCRKEGAICFQRFPQMGSQSVLLWNHQTSGPATCHAKKSAFLMVGRPRLHITLTVCSLAVTNQSGHKLQPQSLYFCLLRQTFLGSKAPKFQVHPLAISISKPMQCKMQTWDLFSRSAISPEELMVTNAIQATLRAAQSFAFKSPRCLAVALFF